MTNHQKEVNNNSWQKDNKPMPENVLNAEQDPNSVPDPLKDELERSANIEKNQDAIKESLKKPGQDSGS